VLTINRLELLNSLKRIAIYANKSSQQIRMKLSATELVTSAEDLDYSNEAKETLPCEYEGEPMEIGFSAKILIETLANLHSNMIDMTFSIPSKAALIYPKTKDDEEDLLMLVMPTMLSQ
jgi:DNA polymerase-3 subunit beta